MSLVVASGYGAVGADVEGGVEILLAVLVMRGADDEIRPEALERIRKARLTHLGMPPDSSYGTRRHIEEELDYSRAIFRAHANWPVIDVTSKAIEETAADILRIYKERLGVP